MKTRIGKIYAVALLIAFIVGQILVVSLAWSNLEWLINCVIGFGVGCVLAPTVHELGHISFGSANGMRLKYSKFFCFRFYEDGGKIKFSFAGASQSQSMPQSRPGIPKKSC